MGWNTNADELATAIREFERRLPGFWWSVGQCNVGAHASCGVDGKGDQAHLLEGIPPDDPFHSHFDVDTSGGTPAEALRAVMHKALSDPRLAEREETQ